MIESEESKNARNEARRLHQNGFFTARRDARAPLQTHASCRSRIVDKSSTAAKLRIFARGTSGSGLHSSLALSERSSNSAAGRTRYTGNAARAWHWRPDSRGSDTVSLQTLGDEYPLEIKSIRP